MNKPYKMACTVCLVLFIVLASKPIEPEPEPIDYEAYAVEVWSIEYADGRHQRLDGKPMQDIGLKEEWVELVIQECQARGIDHFLALAVMMQENRSFNPSVISGTDDYGLFQINKVNHQRMAELGYKDMLDAEDNIKAGVYILAECLESSDSYHEALMAYNMGRGGANRAMAKGIYDTAYSRGVMAYYNSLIDGV